MPGSSPATGLDGLLGRARAGTLGGKSIPGSTSEHGAGGGTPAAVAAGALSGLGLGPGLTPLPTTGGDALLEGLGLGSTVRDGEAWLAQRTREVVEILGSTWGRVSRENIERVLERIGGLEGLWDEGVGRGKGKGKGMGKGEEEVKRTLSVAGNEFVIDVEWIGERVVRVKVEFGGGGEEDAESAGEILRKDLLGSWEGRRWYVSLERFVENLSRLARIDGLGKGSVSSFSALEGINSSLKKLKELEVKREEGERGGKFSQSQIELDVMCQRSGRPTTNSHDKIGLNLEYWVDRRIIAEKTKKSKSPNTDESSSVASPGSLQNPYNLLIDCEAFDATQYPSIRISENWLADTAAEAFSNENLPVWQDPPATFVPNSESNAGADSMDLGISTGTLPNARFIARLNPPVTVPLAAAVEIFNHVGQPIIHQPLQNSTFASLLFPDAAKKAEVAKGFSKDSELHFDRVVRCFDSQGKLLSHRVRFNFFDETNALARTIHEIPFSHPKQLIDILPYLRQWALFGKMLQRSFETDQTKTAELPNGLPLNDTTQMRSTEVETNRVQPTTKRLKTMQSYRDHRYQPYEPPSDTDSDEEESSHPPINRNGIQLPTPPPSVPEAATFDTAGTTSVDVYFKYAALERRIDLDLSISLPPQANLPRGTCLSVFRIQPNAKIETEYDLLFDDDEMPDLGSTDGEQTGKRHGAFGTSMSAREVKERMLKTLTIMEDLGTAVAWLSAERQNSSPRN